MGGNGIELRSLSLVAWLLVGLAGVGCSAESREDGGGDADSDSDSDGDGDGDADGDADTDADGDPTLGCEAIDILFIIDDSASMEEEQNNLIASFPGFIEVLDNYLDPNDEPIEYRVGVTTTGVSREFTHDPLSLPPMPGDITNAEDGALVGQEECGLGEHPWIEGDDPEAVDKFACAAEVGLLGPGTEMPLAAMELAIGENLEPGGPNEGFYRKLESSLLVIVFITDEDDCSLEDGGTAVTTYTGGTCDPAESTGLESVEEKWQVLDTAAGGGGRYVVVSIAGMTPGGCTSSLGDASYAERLMQVVDLSAPHSIAGDICGGDLAYPLGVALDTITLACDELPPLE